MLVASVIGSITLIPVFIAFPTAAMLLKGGAGLMQIAAIAWLMERLLVVRDLEEIRAKADAA